ncbi:DUF1830 domain-containing protein [Leptolyngbya sp. FACHB-261]|uniref:DUF1830 domain-containing protein n=1 Tax=Leptolyngbya sp. FACHB-261 TaxID=2692806 RepID=UPI0016851BD4|nr:DUF1830 domain-containing protein [Leptolyngbya sp. FACHB-261]MBD2103897.1 DUF1830 domain-containing protein [Leptolyngbya sp. FACHB-261]
MSQTFDPVPNAIPEKITCCYVNASSKIQIVRITNIPHWYFERVVFPGQHLLFESVPQASLEVHTGTVMSSILSDTICCSQLQVQENPGGTANHEHKTERIRSSQHHGLAVTLQNSPLIGPAAAVIL